MSVLSRTRWEAPLPYGHAGAIDNMGSVAAPLLAGFALTVATLVLTDIAAFRWPNLVLALLVASISALVASVQFAFRARMYAVAPPDIEQWWPNPSALKTEMMRREQRQHHRQYRVWSERARQAYNIGLVMLGVGFAVSLAPRDFTTGRAVVLCLALVAVIAECVWICHGWWHENDPPEPLPEVGPEPELN